MENTHLVKRVNRKYNPEMLDKERLLVISNVIHADDELTAELKEELDVSRSKSRICLFLSVAAGLTELKDKL
jgi:GTP-binding protein